MAAFYFGTLLQTERISIAFQESPQFRTSKDVQVSDGLPIVFVNSGTRPAAVLGITLYFNLAPDGEALQDFVEACESQKIAVGDASIPLKFESFVLKEKEIIRKNFPVGAAGQDKFVIPLPDWFVDADGFAVSMCVSFQMATPSNSYIVKNIVMPNRYHYKNGVNIFPDTEVTVKPFEIWRNSETIFD